MYEPKFPWLEDRSDTFLLTILILGFISFEIFLSLIDPILTAFVGFRFHLTQAVIAGIATMVAVISYRYTVRSNIRGAIGEIDPLYRSGVKVKPTMYAAHWRPQPIAHWFPRWTVVRFYAYECGGTSEESRRPLNGIEFFDDALSFPNGLSDPVELTPDAWREDLLINEKFCLYFDEEGLRGEIYTTDETEIRKLADHTLRYIDRQLKETE